MTPARTRSWFLSLTAVIIAVSVVLAGCAEGDADFADDDDDNTGATGGTGGDGGGGGENPCGIDCSQIETPVCHMGVCDPDTLTCAVVPAEDGTECEDGEFCTLGDACVSGICEGGIPNTCGMTPAPCEVITCVETTQSCTTATKPDGDSCQPEDLCMINGECLNGLCVGTPRNCQYAPVPSNCYTSVCNPNSGDCEPEVDPAKQGETCIDPSDPCQVDGTCDNAGNCLNTVPLNCSHLTNPSTCVIGVCNTSGVCQTQQQNDGDSCDDLDACTINETCQSGVCTPGSSITTCGPVDNCCPATCNETNDADCILQILLLGEGLDTAGWDAYRNALTAAGETWDEIALTSTADFPDAPTLAGYNTIIWADENTVSYVNDTEAQLLSDWLNLGERKLFVTGIDIMWDMRLSSTGPQHDLYAMWGVTYMGDYAGTGATTINGVAGDPITAAFQSPNGLQLAGSGDSNGDYVDETVGPGAHAGIYAGSGSGVSHGGLSRYDSGTYKVVWLGVNFHNGLTNASQQASLMDAVLDWLKG